MIKQYKTFHGVTVSSEEIDHQHLSNIIWYWTVVQSSPMIAMIDELDLLKRRFNGQLLPYRPHIVRQELNFLRNHGMLHKDPNNFLRIIIFSEDVEIGEIICPSSNIRNMLLDMKESSDYTKSYNPSEDKQYHISFEMIREIYRTDPSSRNTMKNKFPMAFYGVDMKEHELVKTDQFMITRNQLEELLLHAKDYNFTRDTMDNWFPDFAEPKTPFIYLGKLLRRKNHPFNVYTVQKDHDGKVGIYNITRGQWWGNGIQASSLSDPMKKSVTKKEFAQMCGTHDPNNFYMFEEANKLVK